MPRKNKKSRAAKKRWGKFRAMQSPRGPGTELVGCQQTAGAGAHGTGWRHKVRKWPTSVVTGQSHKLVLPPPHPDKKFVLLVGDSHLRAVADGIVAMPEGRFAFGVMSTPGACTEQLRKEVLHAVVPQTPDAVCVLAPSKDLTSSHTVEEAGAAFGRFLATVCARWMKVFVADFVPPLTVDEGYQTLYREELNRVVASFGLKYCHFADEFPLNRPELWAFDGIHLSDDAGMPVLVQLLWRAADEAMEPPAQPEEPHNIPSAASPWVSPQVVVTGEVPALHPPPAEWTVVGSAAKEIMEEALEFSLCAVVTDINLRDEFYYKLAADFISPQTGEGLGLSEGPCKNRLLIQVGLLREDNNFPWITIVDWLRKLFPQHQTADFRSLIERGIVTTLSLGSEARRSFLESCVNFNFVGPICDSIGVERQHLLEMRDFSERALSVEVTNGLILELSNFISREKLAPIIIVSWLKNFNLEFCQDGNLQKAYRMLRGKITKLKICCRTFETRSHRRNAAMERLLQTAFELVPKKDPISSSKKQLIKEEPNIYEEVMIKEEYETVDIMLNERPDSASDGPREPSQKEFDQSGRDSFGSSRAEDSPDDKGEALTLLDIAMLSVQKLSSVYGGKTPESKKISLDLLKNQFALKCKEHPAMLEFQRKLDSLGDQVALAPPAVFLNCNANFLVDVQDAIEQHMMNFEKEIFLSGCDKLPPFENFVNMQESSTSRYIHMACDIVSPRTSGMKNYRKHWVAFCKEMKNPSKLVVNQLNRFSGYFEAAAGLIHHHNEIGPFVSDLLSLNDDNCPNVILESVGADADDSVIQSLVCVLAIIYCKVLGPYWQLLKSEGEYSLFSQCVLSLYQKLIDWSKDPSTLLEPEESTNIFQQFPTQEKVFQGVFDYCNQWNTNRELIRACLERTIKVIAGVCEEHLKDFLPGGIFGEAPSKQLREHLVSCTFSILMADYPFGHMDTCKNPPNKPSKRPSDTSLMSDSSQKDDASGSSDVSTDEFFGQLANGSSLQTEKYKRLKLAEEEFMDNEYIITTVNYNGEPCKSEQDVDKMML